MKIFNMTRKDFDSLPHRKWDEKIVFDSLVILPTRRKHDSGYRIIEAVAVIDGEARYKLTSCSDVIHIGGIVPKSLQSYSIDCLLKSGLFQLWIVGKQMTCGPALSSFEIYPKGE